MDRIIVLVLAVVSVLYTPQLLAQQKKVDPPQSREQTTESYSKEATPVQSRISLVQLSRNFTKAFNEKFPDKVVNHDRWVIVDFVIEPDGTASAIEVIRSDFDQEDHIHLIQLIDKVTMNAWEPATFKGKKVQKQYTLKVGVQGDYMLE